MSSMRRRLKELEKRSGPDSCRECHLKPEQVCVFYPDEGAPKPEVPTCPGCGRSLGVLLKVIYEGEGEGRR